MPDIAGDRICSATRETTSEPGTTWKTRHITIKTPVCDPNLFRRLVTQVRKGDEIRAAIVNEWHQSGRVSYLADFSVVSSADEAVVASAPPLTDTAS